MTASSSTRLAALSPPPLPLRNMSGFQKTQKSSVSVIEWTQIQLDDYNVRIEDTSDITTIIPIEFTGEDVLKGNRLDRTYIDIDMSKIPNFNLSEDVLSGEDIVLNINQTLTSIKSLLERMDSTLKTKVALDGYAKQVLYDFVRAVYIKNRVSLKSHIWQHVQIA